MGMGIVYSACRNSWWHLEFVAGPGLLTALPINNVWEQVYTTYSHETKIQKPIYIYILHHLIMMAFEEETGATVTNIKCTSWPLKIHGNTTISATLKQSLTHILYIKARSILHLSHNISVYISHISHKNKVVRWRVLLIHVYVT